MGAGLLIKARAGDEIYVDGITIKIVKTSPSVTMIAFQDPQKRRVTRSSYKKKEASQDGQNI